MEQCSNPNHAYATDIVEMHKKGDIDALATYRILSKLNDFPIQRETESDLVFIRRCAYSDFDDACWGLSVFNEVAIKYATKNKKLH